MNLIHENITNIEEQWQHDAGAVFLKNGEIIAAFEEERLNRIKHTNKFPLEAIRSCLSLCGGSVDQVDLFALCISEKILSENLPSYSRMLGIEFSSPKHFIQLLLKHYVGINVNAEKIELFDHHYVHASTAFYPSGYDKALVITIDGSGDGLSGSVYLGKGNTLEPLKTFAVEKSLGDFYTRVTLELGFKYFDEYKVMGLAPYGDPSIHRELFKQFYELLPDGDYVIHAHKMNELSKLCAKVADGSDFGKTHMDIAASLQEALEEIVFHMVRHFKTVTGATKLCISGGVGLNCTMNGKLIKSGLFEDIFVYPACSDCGLAAGSALAAYYKHNTGAPKVPLNTLYLGRDIGKANEIEKQLYKWNSLVSFERIDDISVKAAELLANDKVIGWVQGRSEFAPRALGNRSILADPRPAKNKERINAIVKKRESFRPFAPSVMQEYVADYFQIPDNRTYFAHMIFTFMVKPEFKDELGAVIHVDGSARVQTVNASDNLKYWRLIDEFRRLTNVPIVLNTSFNNNAEPIVDTVDDAVVSFLTTNLDYLIVDDYLVHKKGTDVQLLGDLYPSFAPYIRISKSELHRYGPKYSYSKDIKLSNTFNRKTFALSEELYQLLIKVNGTISLNHLLNELPANEQADILIKINELWEKRWIILHPVPCHELAN